MPTTTTPTVYTYDVKTFATIKITAPSEEAARYALMGMSIDMDMHWDEPDRLNHGTNLKINLTQVTVDDGDGDAELVENEGE